MKSSITCPVCGAVSYSPADIENGYCGRCHKFHDQMPGYWRNETSGVLAPAVHAYLEGKEMTPEQIAALRAYLRQWIAAPEWKGDGLEKLRREVQTIRSRAEIDAWLENADREGIDPL